MPENQARPITERQRIFILLRTRLDDIEISALQYCMLAKDDNELQARFEEINPMLREINHKIPCMQLDDMALMAAAASCGPGKFLCAATGECLPYPCPD